MVKCFSSQCTQFSTQKIQKIHNSVYFLFMSAISLKGFPDGAAVKNLPAGTGDTGLIPGLGRSAERNGNRLQYSCLGNCMDRGTWQDAIHGAVKSQASLRD